MKLSGYKKLLLLGVILLIIAGIVVVALKGVNVSLELHGHESVVIKAQKEIDIKDINEICKNIFGNKRYLVKSVELFSDSADIIVESITDEEKNELINKINEKYDTDLTVEDLNVRSNSNIRIRDLVIPFIVPMIISIVVIGAIYGLINRNKKTIIRYFKVLAVTIFTETVIASVIAIVRIPLSSSIITIMIFIAVAQIMFYMNKNK